MLLKFHIYLFSQIEATKIEDGTNAVDKEIDCQNGECSPFKPCPKEQFCTWDYDIRCGKELKICKTPPKEGITQNGTQLYLIETTENLIVSSSLYYHNLFEFRYTNFKSQVNSNNKTSWTNWKTMFWKKIGMPLGHMQLKSMQQRMCF